jgi:hypothetical protein
MPLFWLLGLTPFSCHVVQTVARATPCCSFVHSECRCSIRKSSLWRLGHEEHHPSRNPESHHGAHTKVCRGPSNTAVCRRLSFFCTGQVAKARCPRASSRPRIADENYRAQENSFLFQSLNDAKAELRFSPKPPHPRTRTAGPLDSDFARIVPRQAHLRPARPCAFAVLGPFARCCHASAADMQ